MADLDTTDNLNAAGVTNAVTTNDADDNTNGDRTDNDASAEEMETDEPGVVPNADVVPSDMVLTDLEYDSNSDSDSIFEPDTDEEDDVIFGAKKLPSGTSIYYVSTKAKKLFAARMGRLHMMLLKSVSRYAVPFTMVLWHTTLSLMDMMLMTICLSMQSVRLECSVTILPMHSKNN